MKRFFLLSAVILGIFSYGTLAKAIVLPIVRINDRNHQILRSETEPVTVFDRKLKKLISDMKDTLESMQEGYGLAAPQIGKNSKIFVAQLGNGFQEFINPQILEMSTETNMLIEGCSSVPNILGIVKRPRGIVVRAFDKNGMEFVLEAKNLEARIISHEIDHLNKTLFTDIPEATADITGLNSEQVKVIMHELVKQVSITYAEALYILAAGPLSGI